MAKGGFKKIYNHIDQLGIKKGVDEMGIDKFVNQCALLAAGSGAVAGDGDRAHARDASRSRGPQTVILRCSKISRVALDRLSV